MRTRALLWSGIGMIVVATLLGAAIVFGYTEPPGFDSWWNSEVVENRSDWMLSFALILNDIGGGLIGILVVPLLVIVALLIARRWQAAVFAAAAFLASAGAVQLLKQLFGRARPEDMIVVSDFGSFPSGHVANAATIAVVLWLVFPRVWTAVVGILWIVAMAISRTLLSVHWATDTIGGALVGAGVVLVLGAWLLPWVTKKAKNDPAVAPIG